MKNFLLITCLIALFSCSDAITRSEPYQIEQKQTEHNLSVPASTPNIQPEKPTPLTDDEIIEQKQIAFSNQKINAIYFPELDKNYPYKHYYNDLIIKDGIYYLLIFTGDKDDDYFLINIENGTITEQAKDIVLKFDSKFGIPYTISDLIRDNAVVVNNFNMRHQYVFITNKAYPPFCKKNINNCGEYTSYDLNNFTSIPFLEYTPRSLIMQDTTYDKRRKSSQPLAIGFYAFSNLSYQPEYSSAKSIVIHNPTILRDLGKDESDKVVPADIVSRISKIWRIDQQEKERFLVWFGFEHPFLFMIFDIEKGLDIPENHLENIYFIEYQTMLQKFGKFHDPILRAEKLSAWLKQRD